MAENRRRSHLKLSTVDIWILQSKIKLNAFIGPAAPFNAQDLIGFRRKLNNAILDIEDKHLDTVEIEVAEPECWIIDTVLDKDSYGGARGILLQVYRVLWEQEYDLSLVDEPLDKKFHTSMLRGWESEESDDSRM